MMLKPHWRDRLCRWICGRRFDLHPPSTATIEMPFKIRQASHNMANAAAKMQGLAHELKREADVFYNLVHAMQGDRNE